jgi:hypothetical protein
VGPSAITSDGDLAKGVFITVKRFGMVDLAGQKVQSRIKPDAGVKVIRHPVLVQQLALPPAPAITATPSTPNTPSAQSPVTNAPAPTVPEPTAPEVPATPQPTADKPIAMQISASVGNSLASSIQLGTSVNAQDTKDAPIPGGGKMTLVGGEIGSVSVDPNTSISDLSQGVQQVGQLVEPQDRKMVQVQVQQYTPGWGFLPNLATAGVIDSNGNKYPISGFYALVKNADSKSLLLRYNYQNGSFEVPPTQGGPPDGSIYFIFLIPKDTELKSFTFFGKTQNLDSPVKVQ